MVRQAARRRLPLRPLRVRRGFTGFARLHAAPGVVSVGAGHRTELAAPSDSPDDRGSAAGAAGDAVERSGARRAGQRASDVPLDLPLATAPEWLRRLLAGRLPRPDGARQGAAGCDGPRAAPPGGATRAGPRARGRLRASGEGSLCPGPRVERVLPTGGRERRASDLARLRGSRRTPGS